MSPKQNPKSLEISQRGIKTSQDFSELMAAIMSDVIEERVTPAMANAAVKAGSNLLKVLEMQIKYGEKRKDKKGSQPIIIVEESIKLPSPADDISSNEEEFDEDDEEGSGYAETDVKVPMQTCRRCQRKKKKTSFDGSNKICQDCRSNYARNHQIKEDAKRSKRKDKVNEIENWMKSHGYGHLERGTPEFLAALDLYIAEGEKQRLNGFAPTGKNIVDGIFNDVEELERRFAAWCEINGHGTVEGDQRPDLLDKFYDELESNGNAR